MDAHAPILVVFKILRNILCVLYLHNTSNEVTNAVACFVVDT